MRETGWSLSTVGVRYLRGAGDSKKLLLYRVICNDKLANNDETWTNFIVAINKFVKVRKFMLEYLRTIKLTGNIVGRLIKSKNTDLAYTVLGY